MTTMEDIMSTDITPATGFYATVDGYAIPDLDSDTAALAVFATIAAAEEAAIDTADEAANWLGLPRATIAAVPVANYVAPPEPVQKPLVAADFSALNDEFAPPVARISHTFAIRLTGGMLYCSSEDMANGHRYTVFTDREEAEEVLDQLRTTATDRGLRHTRFDLVAFTTMTAVSGWHTA